MIAAAAGPSGLGGGEKGKAQNVLFQTFDNITNNNKNRPISNTQYLQSPPLFAQMKMDGTSSSKGAGGGGGGAMNSNAMKKTNDVDIFLPY